MHSARSADAHLAKRPLDRATADAAAPASAGVSAPLACPLRRRSQATPDRPQTVALIQQMAREDRLWGAERIRGELLKLGLRGGKRTVQHSMRGVQPPRRLGQTWATFLSTHAHAIWACAFLPVIDMGFRTLYAFVIVELGSRRVVHVGVTRRPTDAWVAQQLREATPCGTAPRFLIRDNDGKFGVQFSRVAAASGIALLRAPVAAPSRLGQALPEPVGATRTASSADLPLRAIPVLGGLHHDYQRVAWAGPAE